MDEDADATADEGWQVPTAASLADYYQRRAPHYDAVYDKRERQADLRRLQAALPPLFAGRDVLEVAAGTGYWTAFIAATANTVLATDYNEAPLAIAATRTYAKANVRFARADAFELGALPGRFTAAFVGFWWSHIPRGRTTRFLDQLCDRLVHGSQIAIVDNRYVHGSNHRVTQADSAGDTYQRRELPDGTTHDVLKNFPTSDELLVAARSHGTRAELTELDYYWLLTFTTA